MRYDLALLRNVEQGTEPPTLRFFRFQEPTVTYGRLQKRKDIAPLAPAGWPVVQRPTGGGVVFHEEDQCLSLCWPRGQAPLPARPQDQYRWIHGAIREALGPELRMAACCDALPAEESFAIRACFKNPVGYDLMKGDQKIVGGALCCQKKAILYQGSIQRELSTADVRALSESLRLKLQ
jgi:lipoyl(octanoyl) transferase